MMKDFLKYPLGFGSFDLQLFAEGDDGDGGAGGTGAPEMEEILDPKTGTKIKVPKGIGAIIGHHISSTRKEVESKFKPIIEQFEGKETDFVAIKAEYEKLKEASMTVEEKAQENARKKILEHETTAKKAVDEAQTWKGRFEKTMIRNDIISSFGDAKLCNPGQAATIFEMEGKAFVSEIFDDAGKPTGEFETRVRIALEDKNGNPEMVEGTPAELFKKWVELDKNAHHLMNSMPAGSGSRGGANRGGMNREKYEGLSAVEKLKIARREQQR